METYIPMYNENDKTDLTGTESETTEIMIIHLVLMVVHLKTIPILHMIIAASMMRIIVTLMIRQIIQQTIQKARILIILL